MFEIPQVNLKDKVSAQEWQIRVDLAASYRLMVMHGWDDLIHTHISARIPGTEYLLINAFGLAFEEVTASNLVKIDIDGNIIDQDCAFEINPAGEGGEFESFVLNCPLFEKGLKVVGFEDFGERNSWRREVELG